MGIRGSTYDKAQPRMAQSFLQVAWYRLPHDSDVIPEPCSVAAHFSSKLHQHISVSNYSQIKWCVGMTLGDKAKRWEQGNSQIKLSPQQECGQDKMLRRDLPWFLGCKGIGVGGRNIFSDLQDIVNITLEYSRISSFSHVFCLVYLTRLT